MTIHWSVQRDVSSSEVEHDGSGQSVHGLGNE